MKLLFDQNLSPKLVNRLADLFPDSSHVASVGLDDAVDDQVWEYARQHGFAIVTKQLEFAPRQSTEGDLAADGKFYDFPSGSRVSRSLHRHRGIFK